jgi:hypothetical protein
VIESKSFTNPFPGLRPFETDEYRLFFGREGQSDALITRLERARFLAVVGTSGSGKSSLVRAGLLPALRGGMMAGAGSGWRICILRPGSDPIGNLAHSLAEKEVLPEAGGGLAPAETEAIIEATLKCGSLGLVDAARQARLGEHDKLLVLVDQFEEVFRFRAARAVTSTGDDAAAFVKLLIEAAQQRQFSIYVVLTMRSDFLGDCAQFQGLPEAINEGQYLIPRMTRDDRRMAIMGPVGVSRGKMSESLINRLLNDVGDNPDQLPILQHALMRTWDYWTTHRREGEPLDLEHYEAIGTMTDALSLHADEAWNELPDDHSRRVAEKLFKALTEKGADNREIRRPTRLSEISAAAEASEANVVAVIDVFRREGRSFLMPPAEAELSSDSIIDISHESLIRNWDRLKKWVDEEAQSVRIYRRLAEAAVLHREGKEGLLIDPALQFALDWREQQRPNRAWANRYHPEFETAIGLLDASRDRRDSQLQAEQQRQAAELQAEQQTRAAQRKRRFTFALALISILALAGVGGVYASFKRAETRKARAERDRLEQQEKDLEQRAKDEAEKDARLKISADADTLGDDYVAEGKVEEAEAAYLEALSQREKDPNANEKWKSWDKLTKFYRRDKKDFTKAAYYNDRLLEAHKVDPQSLQYAEALVQRAALYVDEKKLSEGESSYNQALEIFKGQSDWMNENVILFRLAKLYQEPDRVAERERALRARVETLARYFNQLANKTSPEPKTPDLLVSNYLHALNVLAGFYKGKDNAKAEAVYLQAFEASGYITSNIQDEKVLRLYANLLEDYRRLLVALNKEAESAEVLNRAKSIQEKLPPAKIAGPQNVQPAPRSPTTTSSPQ